MLMDKATSFNVTESLVSVFETHIGFGTCYDIALA